MGGSVDRYLVFLEEKDGEGEAKPMKLKRNLQKLYISLHYKSGGGDGLVVLLSLGGFLCVSSSDVDESSDNAFVA